MLLPLLTYPSVIKLADRANFVSPTSLRLQFINTMQTSMFEKKEQLYGKLN